LECRCLDREAENEKIEFKNAKNKEKNTKNKEKKQKMKKFYPISEPVFLQVTDNGHVVGIPSSPEVTNNESSVIILVPVGIRKVALMHEKTGRYIAIDDTGTVYGSVSQIQLKLIIITINLLYMYLVTIYNRMYVQGKRLR